jgi:hypothetical protein
MMFVMTIGKGNMRFTKRFLRLIAGWALVAVVGLANSQEAGAPAKADPQVLADEIQKEVAEIRGMPFKRPVKASQQTTAQFEAYLDKELNESSAINLDKNYGKVVRALGLYRGPEIKDARALIKMVESSQAAAYYDPDKQTFYVLMGNMADMLAGVMYSHELYHGWQDQYFDLNKYIGEHQRPPAFDADEEMARQAVVEGEATYVMNLWLMKKTLGVLPTHDQMEMVVGAQTQMTTESLRASLKEPQMAAFVGDDVKSSLDAMDKIPPYMIDNLIGAYLKGLGFVFEVQGHGGWKEVEKLYTSAPPASTSQVLHPEKWFARAMPVKYTWGSFTGDRRFSDWDVLDQNVIGEVQWLSIFKEFGMSADAPLLAAWDGDRYAVLKRKNSDELMLLLRTSWETEEAASAFAVAYRRLLAIKFADHPTATAVEQRGTEVLIVEGAPKNDVAAYVTFIGAAAKNRAKP